MLPPRPAGYIFCKQARVVNPWGTQEIRVRRTSDNAILATTTANEVTFATAANTVYVVSYYAPVGQYAVNPAYFTSARSNYPLTALASTSGQLNGLYRYGTQTLNTPVMPTNSYNASNYWVDVVFMTGSGGSGATQTVAFSNTTAATGVGAILLAAGLLAVLPTPAFVQGWTSRRRPRHRR